MHEPGTKRHPMIDMEEFERRLRQSSGNQTEDDPLAELTRLISGQRGLVQRVAEPQGQSSTEARQGATSPEAQEAEAQEPDALQSLDDDKRACQDSATGSSPQRAVGTLLLTSIREPGRCSRRAPKMVPPTWPRRTRSIVSTTSRIRPILTRKLGSIF